MAEELEGLKDTNYHLGENALGYQLQQKASDSSDLSDSKRDMSGSEIPQGTFGRCDLWESRSSSAGASHWISEWVPQIYEYVYMSKTSIRSLYESASRWNHLS